MVDFFLSIESQYWGIAFCVSTGIMILLIGEYYLLKEVIKYDESDDEDL